MSSIRELANTVDAQQVASQLAMLLVRTPNGQFRLRRIDAWIGIPVEGSCHLNDEDQVRLAQQYALNGHEEVFAVRLEELREVPLAYRVRTTADGMRAFNQACSHFNYCLCAPDMSTLVVCSTDDFFVVVGPHDFVTGATGKTVVRGYEDFGAYGSRVAEVWPRMPALVERIRLAFAIDYQQAKADTWVEFPREAVVC